jgi:hypothetical protein
MSNLHEDMKVAFAVYLKESDDFETGKKIAGQRARKALQELSRLIVQRRKEIQDKKAIL